MKKKKRRKRMTVIINLLKFIGVVGLGTAAITYPMYIIAKQFDDINEARRKC